MVITIAECGATHHEVKLPRTYFTGNCFDGRSVVVEDNETNRIDDFNYFCKQYGKYCYVFQNDENGNVVRENNFKSVDGNNKKNEAMGF